MGREQVAFAAHRLDQPEAGLGPQPARAHVNHVRARVKIGFIPATSFPAQPPAYAVTYAVQRFRASPSACSAAWNYLALLALPPGSCSTLCSSVMSEKAERADAPEGERVTR